MKEIGRAEDGWSAKMKNIYGELKATTEFGLNTKHWTGQ